MRGADTKGRNTVVWLAVGLASWLFLPWYAIEEGFFSPGWLPFYPLDPELSPAPIAAFVHGRLWLLPILLFLAAPLLVLRLPRTDLRRSHVLVASGALGLLYLALQGFLIGPLGWGFEGLDAWFGPLGFKQYGMGYGAAGVALALLFHLAEGLAARGFVRGDGFVSGALAAVIALVGVFVFYPVAVIMLRAFETDTGATSLAVLFGNLFSERVWGIGLGSGRVGVAWTTLLLGVLSGGASTALGLAFALVATRTTFRAKRLLRALTILPIITPPFVLGLALILAFGRAGAVTGWMEQALGLPASRYIFGLPGIFVAQLLSFTPIAFLVLIGVVEGISPSMEEAAQTLRADRMTTFLTVSLPLMRPGIANAFLLGFIESIADFGNPLVLGGSYEVLATEIYYSVAGADSDVPRAAALAMVLLAFSVGAFVLQRCWLGNKSYTTLTGKADSGAPLPLPRSIDLLLRAIVLPWAAFTAVMYALVLFGGFVRVFGHDHGLTLEHFVSMFAIGGSDAPFFAGGAWSSLFTTVGIAAVSAPLTAGLGLLTAWLLTRQRFRGRTTFELFTMLSFAIPGTVIGVSYVLAFNVPPLELTGTGVVLVVCFVFRNMPVGIRAGVATLSQIDASLDEASLTLGASSFVTMRRVVLPLLRPAVIAALIYGFVRAMTAVSAVIFLVSADYNLSTIYILGKVEAGEYGPAIAYSAVLVVLMMLAIGGMQLLVGRREIGRRVLSA